MVLKSYLDAAEDVTLDDTDFVVGVEIPAHDAPLLDDTLKLLEAGCANGYWNKMSKNRIHDKIS